MKLIVALLVLLSTSAFAQTYPNKPVRLIVTFAAGGGTMSPRLSEVLGQPVVVENRAGANGAVGTDVVAKSAPDGYTLCVCAAGTMVIGPHLTRQPFDTFRDFAPVTLLAISPFVVTVHPTVPASSVRELIALAKSQPGKINFGSSGTGGAPHLSTELFKLVAGVNMIHVPYKGLGPAMTDLLGGQIQLMFADVGVVGPHLKSGKLRGLAISSSARSSVFPELPTVAEAGAPGYSAGTWYGILAPAGTPEPIVARVSQDIARVLALPDIKSTLVGQGVEPTPMTPRDFAAFIRAEYDKWGKVIKDGGIKLD
jgi:tripartite-type tricarboxylate transporter receptor subunit TctC